MRDSAQNRHPTRRARPAGLVAASVAVLAVGVLLAGCGSSKSKSKSASTTAASGSSTGETSSSGPSGASQVVKVKNDKKFGMILADSKGFTLYTFTNGGKAAPCDTACLKVWPAATVPAGTEVSGQAGVNALGTTMLPGGQTVLTYQGLPLYRFAQDKDEGDAYGDGINSFGGLWHVVKTSGSATTNSGDSSGTSSSETTSGGGGY